ncbi:MAG: ABC transporter substrate-binding protein [Thermomicrobiales bacterium]|nr:ABC transporter substrate-binding protein [Thermomicrobiales bacterium]
MTRLTDGHGATRRQVLGGAAGFAAATLLTTRGFAQEGSPEAEGEWTFTDDLGVTVTLPHRPTRIVADVNAAAPLWDFGIRPIAVSGWTVDTPAAFGNVPLDTPIINAVAGEPEPDIEQLLELDAELFVTITWGFDDVWSFTSVDAYERTQQAVPVLAISVAGVADENLLGFVELAEALGADLESPELVQAKADFEAATEAMKAAAAEKSDLATFFGYISLAEGVWYAAYPPDWSDLTWYRSLGLNIIDPDVEPGAFWETISNEEAIKYPADILFNSTRAGTSTLEELQANPIFNAHPAIAAGQVFPWNQDFILSYQGLTDALNTVIDALANAEKVTG